MRALYKELSRFRNPKRRRVISDLTCNAQRFATAGKDFESRALMQQMIGESRTGSDEMFAVVENQQELFVAQIIIHELCQRVERQFLQAKHLRQRRDDL